ncbi:hypothetical protein IFM89_015810 [Coptis chinensis]|uniref:FH2 domain-containing protein n=1 Tax=Coptis chinensis TaxID=261450 RepID=A0A835IQE2_9MAGN|nr:hypothetical protein IFM89_015810 [Coptis chinensis]
MISGYRIPHLISFISILIFFLNVSPLWADSSVDYVDSSNGPTMQERSWMENNEDGKGRVTKKVSGEDKSDEKRALILEKFRLLLGMRSFKAKSSNCHTAQGCSPSPAPSNEVEAQAPAPVVHKHIHSHPPPPHSRSSPPRKHHEVEQGHQYEVRRRRIVLAIAVCTGVAFLITVLGLLFFCWKFRRSQQRRSVRKVVLRSRRSRYLNSSHSTSKVSFDLGPEHFYVNSLGPHSEPDASELKHISETMSMSSKQNQITPFADKIESESDSTLSLNGSGHCSSVEEFFTVHEIKESMVSEYDRGNTSQASKFAPAELLSSDDESFHTVCTSHSSSARISDASNGDLTNPMEVASPLSYPNMSSPNLSVTPHNQSPWRKTPPTPYTAYQKPPLLSDFRTFPNYQIGSKQTVAFISPISPQQYIPFQPPPPLSAKFLPSDLSSRLMQITSTAPNSSLLNESSPQNSSPSGLNSKWKNEFRPSPRSKSQQALLARKTQCSPAPPCPPTPPPAPTTFFPGHSNSLRHPPPPPGQLPQLTPVGKDGVPLPKLKPLHWDKVRAEPHRSMVWDKLRSSSFE